MTYHATNFAILFLACLVSASTAFSTFNSRVNGGVQLQMSQQAEYGQSLEMPDTYASCGRCQTVYAITENDLGNGRGR